VKRSPQLAPLSRDHHHALEVALRLRRATEADAGAAAARFLDFWERDGRRHFEIEEQLLLPALGAEEPGWAAASERVRAEHADVRARAGALAGLEGAGLAGAARELGELLAAHVRFEERELFVLLEERLPAGELDELGRAVAAAEAAG
jgi:Hemerythrin HHE cation binding domain